MTVNTDYFVGPYNTSIALKLLGPEDFGGLEPAGCLDQLILIIKHLALSLLRVFNYVCGDHQWYNNRTACLIINQYIGQHTAEQHPDIHLHEKICRLYNALLLRADGNQSYAQTINVDLLHSCYPIQTALEVIADREIPYLKDRTDALALPQINLNPYRELLIEAISSSTVLLINEIDDDDEDGNDDSEAEVNEEKSQLLMNICEVLAKVSPEQAIAIANRISNNFHKAEAFCRIAETQVNTRPDQANSLLQQALAATDLLGESWNQGCILAHVAKIQALIAPEQTLATANRIQMNESAPWRVNALIAICKAQALLHPNQARTIANLIQDPRDFYRYVEALCEIYKVQIAVSPLFANELLVQISSVTQLIQDERSRDWALCSFASAQALSNPEQALATAERIQDVEQKTKVLCTIGKIQALSHPDQARETANKIEDTRFLSKKVELLCAIYKAQAPTNLRLANELLSEAFAAIRLIHQGPSRALALKYIVEAQALMNPDLAFAIANLIDQDEEKDEALCTIAKAQVKINPEQALTVIHTIVDDRRKVEVLSEIAEAMSVVNPEKTKVFFGLALTIASKTDREAKEQGWLYYEILKALANTL